MNFSLAILVNDEYVELYRLLDIISRTKGIGDEIVVLQDDNCSAEKKIEIKKVVDKFNVNVYKNRKHTGDFSKQKNYLNSLCTKEWIINLDADELISDQFISSIRKMIETETDIDSIHIPRINIIDGASDEFLTHQKNMPGFGWVINEFNHINFPDYQQRVYLNNKEIRWDGEVHEVLINVNNQSAIPAEYTYLDLFIKHPKTMNKQFLQNQRYLTLIEDLRLTTSDLAGLNDTLYDDIKLEIDLMDYNGKDNLIIQLNDDFSLESLEVVFNTTKHNKLNIIWITDNHLLYCNLLTIPSIKPYFISLDDTPQNIPFYFKFKETKIKDGIRYSYTINKKDSDNILLQLFNLEGESYEFIK